MESNGRVFITIIFSYIIFLGYSQNFEIFHGDTINRIDSRGLKFGRHLTFDSKHKVLTEAFYNILILEDVDWTQEMNNVHVGNHMTIMTGSGYEIFYITRQEYMVSVPNGLEITYASESNNSINISVFDNGQLKTTKEILNNRIVSEIKTKDMPTFAQYYYHDGDTSVAKIEYGKKFFSKNEFKKICKDFEGYIRYYDFDPQVAIEHTDCYPFKNLKLARCEFGFGATQSMASSNTLILSSRSNESVIVKNISSSNKYLETTNIKGEQINSLTVTPQKTETLILTYTPEEYQEDEQAKITLETDNFLYSINCYLQFSHINENNIGIKSLRIRKSNCRPTFLIIHDFDRFYLYKSEVDATNKNERYIKSGMCDDTGCITSLDLTDLATGQYFLLTKNRDNAFITKVDLID
jgi:hypothetical protein